MKKYILLVLILVSFTGCKFDDNTQTLENNYPQCMQTEIDTYIQSSDEPGETPAQITKYTYKGQDAYGFDPGSEYADWLYTYVNSSCETICEFGGIAGVNTCEDWEDEAVFIEIVWTDNH